MFDALGCRGLARVDFFLTADGPVLNEVNTMPGLCAQSQLPRMMRTAGWDYPALLDLLIGVALDDVAHAGGPAVVA
jgi:D-alanine-D-alanine ligase